MESIHNAQRREAWNKVKLVGQKAPLKLKEIWAIPVRLQMQERLRELALFDLGIDSKLRACDLVKLRARRVPWRSRRHASHRLARGQQGHLGSVLAFDESLHTAALKKPDSSV